MDEKRSVDGFSVSRNNSGGTPINVRSDFKPRESAPVEEIPATPLVPEASFGGSDDVVPPTQTPEPVTPPEPTIPASKAEIDVLKHKNKSLKVWLTVLIVIVTALVVGGVVYFMQTNKAQQDLSAAQTQNQQLQKQLEQQQATQTSTQIDSLNKQIADLTSANKDLTAQNKTLTDQVTALNAYIKQLTTVATQLKTTCGTACSTITIPTPPATTTTTTTPSN